MKTYLSIPGRLYDFSIITIEQRPEFVDSLKILYGEYCVEVPKRAVREITVVSDDPVQEVLNSLNKYPYIDSGVIALHGAAVEYCGKAYVFLAATRTGKSTLTSYLISKGLGYIAEDCVLIRKEDRCVIPCTIPIHLREGGKKILNDLGILHEYSSINLANVKRYIYQPELFVTDELPIGTIFFITRNNVQNKVRQCEKVLNFEKLLRAPIAIQQVDREYIKTLLMLAECSYDIIYKDMDYVYKVVCGIEG